MSVELERKYPPNTLDYVIYQTLISGKKHPIDLEILGIMSGNNAKKHIEAIANEIVSTNVSEEIKSKVKDHLEEIYKWQKWKRSRKNSDRLNRVVTDLYQTKDWKFTDVHFEVYFEHGGNISTLLRHYERLVKGIEDLEECQHYMEILRRGMEVRRNLLRRTISTATRHQQKLINKLRAVEKAELAIVNTFNQLSYSQKAKLTDSCLLSRRNELVTLLFKGYDLDQVNEQQRGLIHYVCEENLTDLLTYLLEKNVSFENRDSGGFTPQDIARQKGFSEIVSKLAKLS